jgi:hypothetical protein
MVRRPAISRFAPSSRTTMRPSPTLPRNPVPTLSRSGQVEPLSGTLSPCPAPIAGQGQGPEVPPCPGPCPHYLPGLCLHSGRQARTEGGS